MLPFQMHRFGDPGVPLRSILLAVVSAVLVACAGAEHEADTAAGAQLRLVVAEGRVALVSAEPIVLAQHPPHDDLAESDLRWSFANEAGDTLVSGRSPDPRLVHVETFPGDDPAVGEQRAGAGVITIDVPDVAGRIVVTGPDGAPLGALDYLPVGGESLTAAQLGPGKADFDHDSDVLGTPQLLAGSGQADKRFNVLFVPEGYLESELDQFHRAVDDAVAVLRGVPGYAENWALVNVYRQDIRSRESGISDPRAGDDKDTAFNVAFGDGQRRVRRCAMPSDVWDATSVGNLDWLRAKVAADVVVVLANTTETAGCARFADRFIVQSVSGTATRQGRVLAHELGHALFGLADEYEGGEYGCGHGPNLTHTLERSLIPWADLIGPATAVPTPDTAPTGTVGAFEGGGYCSTGVWRPSHNCMMRDSGADFCPVCRRIVERAFEQRAGAFTRVEVTNAVGEPVWVRCAGRASATCTGYERLADGATVELRLEDGTFAIQAVAGSELPWIDFPVVAPARQVTIYRNPLDPLTPPSDRDAGMRDGV